MDILFTFSLLLGLYALQRNVWMEKLSPGNLRFMDILLAVHLVLFTVYIIYAYLTASDSFNYYRIASEADSWWELWGQQTAFMNFITWPFANLLGLSYNSVMLIFSYLGFQGIVFCYLAAKENITGLRPVAGSFTILECLFLLPNLHFWSSSIGKGSVMLLAVGLLVYGLSRFNRRKLVILLGGSLMFLVRPHILYAFLLGIALAVLFSSKGLSKVAKSAFLAGALFFLYIVSDDVSELTGNSGLNVFESKMLAHRTAELGKSNSGVSTGNNQLLKLFTFWFRPLFIDAPGVMGIIVSFENAFLLYLFVQILRKGLQSWKQLNTYFRVLAFSFLFASIALAQVAGNLGIVMRQKSQVMPLFFIFYACTISFSQRRSLS